MSTQPKALRLADALDAEFVQGRISNSTGRKSAVELRRLHEVNQDLLKALHEALETEQKPVAWISEGGDVSRSKRYMDEMGFNCNPLYTAPPKRDLTCVCGAVWEGETMVHPPRKREWVGLTHPQIHELDWPDGVSFEDILLFVRAIEAKLKEKNA